MPPVRLTLLLAAQCLAFWPVGRWYVARTLDGSDEPWGILALAAALVFIVRDARVNCGRGSLLMPAMLTLFYACTYPLTPPLVRAMIAVTAVAASVRALCGRNIHPGSWGLMLLSLPVMASLQFYAGYPLRWVVGHGMAALLRLVWITVSVEGACLAWGTRSIAVDAPCSGVRMLWAGMLLALCLACLCGLSRRGTLALVLLALPIVVAGNILRASALFFLEAGFVSAPPWVHPGIGIVTFALTGLLIIRALPRRQEVRACAT